MQIWLIGDYAIPYLLRTNGFKCEHQNIPGSTCTDWYVTNCPVPMDGEYQLPDGVVIQGCSGIELRIKQRLEPVTPLD